MKTTNYYDAFIEVAEDCPVETAEVPPQKGLKKTFARLQYEMLKDNPYKYTSDDVLFQVYATRNGIDAQEFEKAREQFFAKGQPCFRSSPLTKRYGWGVHSDSEGRIALYAVESDAYKKLAQDADLRHLKAMRLRRK
jgi:hypothetical protein